MEKTISVIIPVYNCAQYVEQAVYSIEEQSKQIDEIILVDDGSTDGSEIICDNLSNKLSNVQVIHQSNSGVSAARNKGISVAKGYYITFCDADDMWQFGFLDESVFDLLRKDYDIVGFQHYNADEKMNLKQLVSNPNLLDTEVIEGGGGKAIWKHQKRHLGCLFFKRSFIQEKRIRFPNGLTYNEDEIFKVSAEFLSKRMVFCERPMYIYRIHNNSAVHNLDKDILGRYQAWMAAWRNMDAWLREEHNKLTNFGARFAEAYFIEMCVVYCEALQPIAPLQKLIDEHITEPIYTTLQISDYPDYMKNDVFLFKNRKRLFFLKHRAIGVCRYIKHLIIQ